MRVLTGSDCFGSRLQVIDGNFVRLSAPDNIAVHECLASPIMFIYDKKAQMELEFLIKEWYEIHNY